MIEFVYVSIVYKGKQASDSVKRSGGCEEGERYIRWMWVSLTPRVHCRLLRLGRNATLPLGARRALACHILCKF